MLETLLTPYIPSRFLEDEKYRNWHIRGINPLPGIEILGVHIPDLKKIAATLVKEGEAAHFIREFERLETVDHRSGLSYEEKMLWGILVNRLPCSYEDRLKRVIRFVPAIDNWCVCDIFCGDALWCRKHKDETWKFLQSYFHSTQEFDVRFAVVLSLYHYLEEEYIDSIFQTISTLDYDRIESEYDVAEVHTSSCRGIVGGPVPYYVNMAVAWLMATALYKFPEKTREFANSGAIPENILKLYKRKARESFKTKQTNPL